MKNLIYLSFVIGIFGILSIGLYVFMRPYQHIEAYTSVRNALKDDIPKILAEEKDKHSNELNKIKAVKDVKEQLSQFENPVINEVVVPEGKAIYNVTLNVQWLPDGYLTEEQSALQKVKLEDAKDQIIKDVEIDEDEVIVNSLNWDIPSFMVIIDDEKLEKLKEHLMVARVEKEEPGNP